MSRVHASSWLLLVGGLVLVGLLIALAGFGVAPWVVVGGGFCIVIMAGMIWMMVAMGKDMSRRD